FVARLNRMTGLAFRLPTEVEWEYACRSGGREEKFCGGEALGATAWYSGNSGDLTHEVGRRQANGLGLYDMSGNVWEWTCSRYSAEKGGDESRCQAGAEGDRVYKGGAWNLGASRARAAYRGKAGADQRLNGLGLRLVR
ncbi:MAG: formylglycine-generating enzyme family protein, partial [Gammaproteobacteria bacterium]|nr:formylglycine-generating enzyme family protein [Gammaproteobacteria bacterium]